MEKKFISKSIIFTGVLLIALLWTVAIVLAQGPGSVSKESDFVPGEILVKFKPSVDTLDTQRALDAEGLHALEVSRSGLARVQVTPGREAETIARLQAREDVEIASVNHIFYAVINPDDTSYGLQWGMPKIEAPAAWDISTGNSSVVVAIVDSGLDTSHSEFSGRIIDPRDEIEGDSTPQDTCNHGTHVTGIIAAKGNNGTGVAGMAWDIKVMPVRALTKIGSQCTGSEFNIHNGIDWAVSHGAKVINLSIGALPSSGFTCEQQFPTMSLAVKDAYNAGVLVVAASGNNSTNRLVCPAFQTEAMAVGATTSSDSRASYSNYGVGLNVVAPGSSIYSTIPGGYSYMSGTSMATPHVSGLAALIWSVDTTLTRDQVWSIIQDTADDLGSTGWDQFYGYGRINARRALEPLVSIDLQDVSGQELVPPIYFMVDDHLEYLPSEKTVQITTTNLSVITWTATISPSVSWLSISPPISGLVSASTTADFTVVATRPVTYTNYSTTTLVVTGTTSTGLEVGPTTSEVRINYMQELFRYRFPIIFKQ